MDSQKLTEADFLELVGGLESMCRDQLAGTGVYFVGVACLPFGDGKGIYQLFRNVSNTAILTLLQEAVSAVQQEIAKDN